MREPNGSKKVILDACCVFNLTTATPVSFTRVPAGVQLFVDETVLRREIVGLGGNLSPVAEKLTNWITPIRIETEAEATTTIKCAAQIDDAAARTIALAVHRGIAVATDEKLVREVLARVGPQIIVYTTSDITRMLLA